MKTKKIPYVLGIDLGANSIGWSILDLDNQEPIAVRRSGSRAFEAAAKGDLEAGKEESCGQDRRLARGARRRLERIAMRSFGLFRLLQQNGLLPPSPTPETTERPKSPRKLFSEERAGRDSVLAALDRQLLPVWQKRLKKEKASPGELHLLPRRFPYVLRARALDQRLEPYELGRALYHLGQRRGYKSNRKVAPKGDEKKKMGEVEKGIREIQEGLQQTGARTLGEFLACQNPEQQRIRGRWTSRNMYEHEFEKIWKSQAPRHPALLTPELKKKIRDQLFYQRPLKSARDLLGGCEFEPDQPRAPKACLEFQRFRILQTVNNLRILSDNAPPRFLEPAQKTSLIAALAKGDLKVGEAKKILGVTRLEKLAQEAGPQTKIPGNRTAEKACAAIGPIWEKLSDADRDHLVQDWLSFQSEEPFARHLLGKHAEQGFTPETARVFAALEFEDGHCGLSREAMRKLIPHLEKGEHYMTAVAQCYDPPLPEPLDLLPPAREALPHLRNPVVERSLTELRKVVNALVREYGKPDIIRVELARDLKKSRKDREEISKVIKANEAAREKARERIMKEAGNPDPSRADKEKSLLWEECGGVCPYTGKRIPYASLFGMNPRFDIEHIIPFSRSLDNSFGNKTLCCSDENRNRKRNHTPFEAYSGTPEKYDEILKRVGDFTGAYAKAKLRRFKMQPDEVEKRLADFSSRQLNDTRYASRLAIKYLGMLYGGVIDEGGTRRVQATAGEATAHVRNVFGLNKILNDGGAKTRDDHRHHAVDAVAIALCDPSIVKKLAEAAKLRDYSRRGLFAPLNPPWDGFVSDVAESIGNIVVSHRVTRKLNGALHEQTLYGRPARDSKGKECVVLRRELHKLKASEIDKIVDPRVREAVKTRLEELGGTPDKAFADPANHPWLTRKDGGQQPIHKVRIMIATATQAIAQAKPGRTRRVITGSNHHLVVYETLDKKGKVKWDCEVVSLMVAKDRLRRKLLGQKIEVVQRDLGPDKKFVFSLVGGDVIEIDESEEERNLYRIRTVPQSKQLAFVRLNDARLKKDILASGQWRTAFVETLRKLNCRKVNISPLGQVRPAHD